MSTNFTNFKIFPLKNPTGAMQAGGSVVIGGLVEVRFTIMSSRKGGYFASLPSKKGKDREGKDTWWPEVRIPNDEMYKEFQTLAVQAFNDKMGGKAQESAGEESQIPAEDDIPF